MLQILPLGSLGIDWDAGSALESNGHWLVIQKDIWPADFSSHQNMGFIQILKWFKYSWLLIWLVVDLPPFINGWCGWFTVEHTIKIWMTTGKYWLVVYRPLWKMMEWKSVGMKFPYIWKVIKAMFQTTNQKMMLCQMWWFKALEHADICFSPVVFR